MMTMMVNMMMMMMMMWKSFSRCLRPVTIAVIDGSCSASRQIINDREGQEDIDDIDDKDLDIGHNNKGNDID